MITLTWSQLPLDLKFLAVATAVCSLLFGAFILAELTRFTEPAPVRKAARHRRRLSTSDVVAEVRDRATDWWWGVLGLATLATAGVAAAAGMVRRRIVQTGA